MIWSDPWITAAATDQTGPVRRFCTRLWPPVAALGETGRAFRCLRVSDMEDRLLHSWIDLVGTRWSVADVRERLEGARIALLLDESLLGTCVLRPSLAATDTWILETLRAVRGNGALLLRAAIRWLWDDAGGPVILNFTWELTGAQLLAAWWRGWLRSAAAIQYGWVWRSAAATSGCSFCSNNRDPPAFVRQSPIRRPTLFGSVETGNWAIVSDSGLGDGWGIVSVWRGTPPWTDIAMAGRWDALWCRGPVAPVSVTGSEWRWSGEFVVVGALNCWDPKEAELEWVTAEISSASARAETPPHPADSALPPPVAGPSVG